MSPTVCFSFIWYFYKTLYQIPNANTHAKKKNPLIFIRNKKSSQWVLSNVYTVKKKLYSRRKNTSGKSCESIGVKKKRKHILRTFVCVFFLSTKQISSGSCLKSVWLSDTDLLSRKPTCEKNKVGLDTFDSWLGSYQETSFCAKAAAAYLWHALHVQLNEVSLVVLQDGQAHTEDNL